MTLKHVCKIEFDTRKIDSCSGIGFNICYGIKPMIFETWYEDQDGTECYFDNWMINQVNYCPYCGLKSEIECPSFRE